jgi:hypothetical protein
MFFLITCHGRLPVSLKLDMSLEKISCQARIPRFTPFTKSHANLHFKGSGYTCVSLNPDKVKIFSMGEIKKYCVLELCPETAS